MNTLILRRHYHRTLLATICAALVLTIGIIISFRQAYAADSETPAANEHIITLHDDGVEKGFITKKHSLREALAEAKIRLDERDRTEPGIDEALVAGSYEVNIYRARPVLVRDNGIETKVITSYRTPKQIAKEAKLTLQDEDITTLAPSNDPIADGAAEMMNIKRATAFTFDFYGKSATSYTQATTVGDMLKEKHIEMKPVDGISIPLDTKITPNLQVRLWRNGVQTVTVEEEVAFQTKKVEDADQPASYKLVQTPGVKGSRTVTYEVNMQNGVEVARKEINSVVTKQPTQQVEVVGSKGSFSGSFAEALARLRACESGGNYANTKNPKYRGAYQYDYSTWANYGGFYDPADAPPAVQDEKAWETYKRRGWQPWPSCRVSQSLQDIYR